MSLVKHVARADFMQANIKASDLILAAEFQVLPMLLHSARLLYFLAWACAARHQMSSMMQEQRWVRSICKAEIGKIHESYQNLAHRCWADDLVDRLCGLLHRQCPTCQNERADHQHSAEPLSRAAWAGSLLPSTHDLSDDLEGEASIRMRFPFGLPKHEQTPHRN